MPYSITTRKHWHGPAAYYPGSHAVATLEEAQRFPEHEGWDAARCEDCGHFEAEHESGWCAGCDNGGRDEPNICRAWRPSEVAALFIALPKTGGTIGPLPDGTVIEVERIGFPELGDRVGRLGRLMARTDIIDAYNAQNA